MAQGVGQLSATVSARFVDEVAKLAYFHEKAVIACFADEETR